MSRSFSRVILVGNLGRDPEMRYSQNGTPITNFTLAVNRRRRGQDGNWADETDWYRISCFGRNAETAAEYLKRGQKVLVEGQLQIRTFTGQDGVERTSVEVNADNYVMLTPRDDPGEGGYRSAPAAGQPDQRGQQAGGPPGRRPNMEDDFDDLDDVPF
jgi:single-strand DNA-binding protein